MKKFVSLIIDDVHPHNLQYLLGDKEVLKDFNNQFFTRLYKFLSKTSLKGAFVSIPQPGGLEEYDISLRTCVQKSMNQICSVLHGKGFEPFVSGIDHVHDSHVFKTGSSSSITNSIVRSMKMFYKCYKYVPRGYMIPEFAGQKNMQSIREALCCAYNSEIRLGLMHSDNIRISLISTVINDTESSRIPWTSFGVFNNYWNVPILLDDLFQKIPLDESYRRKYFTRLHKLLHDPKIEHVTLFVKLPNLFSNGSFAGLKLLGEVYGQMLGYDIEFSTVSDYLTYKANNENTSNRRASTVVC